MCGEDFILTYEKLDELLDKRLKLKCPRCYAAGLTKAS